MCANDYSFEEWNTIHHEMGHIQYFMQYEHLPIGFRDAQYLKESLQTDVK